jgi:choline kinase
MRVLILVAGTGTRLWPLTRNTPKSLLDLGDGLTLLETQLEAVRPSGIRDIVLVTGYRSAQIEAKIQYYEDFDFEVVYNPFFDVSNNLVSAWLAMQHIKEDFVLVNGDDVFRSEVFDRLLATSGDVVMVVSRKPEYDDDDMKVHISADRVYKVSKDLARDVTNGESIGMIKFRQSGGRWFSDELDRMVREKENLDTYYLQAIQNLMDNGVPVNYVECSPDEWAEIDFHPDLTSVREALGSKLSTVTDPGKHRRDR